MTKISETDKKLLQNVLQDVKPLKAGEKAHVVAPKVIPAQHPKIIESNDPPLAKRIMFYDNDEIQPEHIFFARPGLQHRVHQQLRLGKMRPEATLDLHGFNVEEAKIAVSEFLIRVHTAQLRTVKIIHGKGGAILRSKVYQWLPQCPQVLAVASTIASDGGTGAVYVLLSRRG